jgi:hypothetical protein
MWVTVHGPKREMMGVKLSMTLRTGKMSTAIQFRNKTARQVFGATTFSLLASVAIALTPTKASAFDIGGLVDTAMAMQMGHYQGGYAGGHRTHVASRHDSSSDNNDGGVEHDARDPNTALIRTPLYRLLASQTAALRFTNRWLRDRRTSQSEPLRLRSAMQRTQGLK